jgi:16S rRNA (cytosine1402-N4)-methyltransferase
MKQIHQPVLVEEVITWLNPKDGEAYFDGTAGYGGHAAEIIQRIGDRGRAVLVDRDRIAIKALGERFDQRAEIIHATFAEAAESLLADGSLFDLILLDLGVSSPQFDNGERGFSFNKEAALDMRMDQSQRLTAADVVNHYSEAKLAEILSEYGEEPRARRVAEAIVSARPLRTTTELAQVVRKAAAYGGSDAATRTFQALRLEVNGELEELKSALPNLVRLLAPGGRLGIITFHSLEDRIVKSFFDTESRDCICPPKQPVCTCNHQATIAKVTKKPVLGETHDRNNPRARSAKLRVVVKIKPKTKGGDS